MSTSSNVDHRQNVDVGLGLLIRQNVDVGLGLLIRDRALM
jgi:hypothetical protein